MRKLKNKSPEAQRAQLVEIVNYENYSVWVYVCVYVCRNEVYVMFLYLNLFGSQGQYLAKKMPSQIKKI